MRDSDSYRLRGSLLSAVRAGTSVSLVSSLQDSLVTFSQNRNWHVKGTDSTSWPCLLCSHIS